MKTNSIKKIVISKSLLLVARSDIIKVVVSATKSAKGLIVLIMASLTSIHSIYLSRKRYTLYNIQLLTFMELDIYIYTYNRAVSRQWTWGLAKILSISLSYFIAFSSIYY